MRSVRALVGACCLILLVVCSGCGSDAPSIVIVYGDPDSTQLEVGVDVCNRNPSVDAEETAEEVRLTATADEPSGDGEDDCRDSVVLTLEAPLGDRVVIDESTGERVEVAPLED
jgi:hypothetical protein